jgi:hypothetical protein
VSSGGVDGDNGDAGDTVDNNYDKNNDIVLSYITKQTK